MLEKIFKKYESEVGKVLEHTKKELAKLRTGRARPSLIENVVVEAYGSRMRLLELAGITVPEPNLLFVKMWDQNVIKDVERALSQSNLGLHTSIEGDTIRLRLPDLTQERRQEFIKVLHKVLEQSRIATRTARDKVREEIQSLEQASKISEDEKFRGLEDLDEKTKECIAKIDSLGKEKEKEIKGE